MGLQFVFGGSGSGKSTLVFQKVIEQSQQDMAKHFFLMVPDQFTMYTQKDQWDYREESRGDEKPDPVGTGLSDPESAETAGINEAEWTDNNVNGAQKPCARWRWTEQESVII